MSGECRVFQLCVYTWGGPPRLLPLSAPSGLWHPTPPKRCCQRDKACYAPACRGQASDNGVHDLVECLEPAMNALRKCAQLGCGRSGLGLCAL